MNRVLASVFLTACLMGAAHAQQPMPAVQIELPLSPQEQADLRSICVLAMRSPAITDSDAILMIGEFCAKLRNSIAFANAKAKGNAPPPAEPPPQPKE